MHWYEFFSVKAEIMQQCKVTGEIRNFVLWKNKFWENKNSKCEWLKKKEKKEMGKIIKKKKKMDLSENI